jgi:hypothetical protein
MTGCLYSFHQTGGCKLKGYGGNKIAHVLIIVEVG